MKKTKKICFVEAKSPSTHIFSFVEMFRLGSPLLATILQQRGFQTEVFIEDIREVYDEEMDEILEKDLLTADLICISTITSTAMRAYKIADRIREFREEKKTDIKIVIGGPHATFLPAEALLHADFVVRGEGEESLVELVEMLNRKQNPYLRDECSEIKGLSYRDRCGCLYHNAPRELVGDLNDAPMPDFSLIAHWKEKNVIPIATSRGCPFECEFCSVIPMFGRQMRFKSVERVTAEIRNALSFNPRHIFFIDDNFAANKKSTREICQMIIRNGFKFHWSAQVRTDILNDPELIREMALAGCINVFIGFESIDPATLIAYNKKQKVDEAEKCIKLLHQAGINIHGMFVIDPDRNDVQLIWDTVKYAKKMKLSSLQLLAYIPLPGTPVFDRMVAEDRLLHRDWSKYDAHHAVFQPKIMSVRDLQIELLKGMRSFYGWGYSLKWLLHSVLSPLDMRAFVQGLFYARIGFYGRRLTKIALKKAPAYLEFLRQLQLQKELQKVIKIESVVC